MMRNLLILGAVIAMGAARAVWFRSDRRAAEVLRLPGTVEVQEVQPSSKVGGRVKEVLVAESQLVQAGQPLAVLDAPELEAQRDQARERLAAARAVLAKEW